MFSAQYSKCSRRFLELDPDCLHTCSMSPCRAVDILFYYFAGNFGSPKTQTSPKNKHLVENKIKHSVERLKASTTSMEIDGTFHGSSGISHGSSGSFHGVGGSFHGSTSGRFLCCASDKPPTPATPAAPCCLCCNRLLDSSVFSLKLLLQY